MSWEPIERFGRPGDWVRFAGHDCADRSIIYQTNVSRSLLDYMGLGYRDLIAIDVGRHADANWLRLRPAVETDRWKYRLNPITKSNVSGAMRFRFVSTRLGVHVAHRMDDCPKTKRIEVEGLPAVTVLMPSWAHWNKPRNQNNTRGVFSASLGGR